MKKIFPLSLLLLTLSLSAMTPEVELMQKEKAQLKIGGTVNEILMELQGPPKTHAEKVKLAQDLGEYAAGAFREICPDKCDNIKADVVNQFSLTGFPSNAEQKIAFKKSLEKAIHSTLSSPKPLFVLEYDVDSDDFIQELERRQKGQCLLCPVCKQGFYEKFDFLREHLEEKHTLDEAQRDAIIAAAAQQPALKMMATK